MAGLDDKQWKIVEKGLEKIDDIVKRMTSLEVAILGNGVKGLKEKVYDLDAEVEKLKECQGKEKPPRFSWKQVIANTIIIVTFAGFLTGFIFFMLDDVSEKVKRLEDKIDTHIIMSVIP